VQPLTRLIPLSTKDKHTPTLKQTGRTPGKMPVHSPRCSEYCEEKLVCDDAELAVNDTFRDVRQCSSAGSGFDCVGCLFSQKSAESTGSPQLLGQELVLEVCTAAP
jgi:hypothetical protein